MPSQPVPDLTRIRDIKLNDRVSLRWQAKPIGFSASDIALVRVHRGEAVGRLYSGWRLRFSRENAPSCRPIGKELISIDVPLAAR
jgi:hypothetical protein